MTRNSKPFCLYRLDLEVKRNEGKDKTLFVAEIAKECNCRVSVAEEKDSKRGLRGDAREGPGPGSRTRGDLLGPHCPGCPPRIQFLPSSESTKTRQDVLLIEQDTIHEKEEEPTSNAM